MEINLSVIKQKNGKFDIFIAEECSSGCHYSDLTAEEVGKEVQYYIEDLFDNNGDDNDGNDGNPKPTPPSEFKFPDYMNSQPTFSKAVFLADLLKRRIIQYKFCRGCDADYNAVTDFDEIKSEEDAIAAMIAEIKNVESEMNKLYRTDNAYLKSVLAEFASIPPSWDVEDIVSAFDVIDTEVCINDIYGNKFYNEIPLHPVIEKFLDFFAIAEGIDYDKGKKFIISIYDCSDYDIAFNTREEAESFIDANSITPYTLFEDKGGYAIEIRSE